MLYSMNMFRFYPTRLALNIATGQNKPLSRDPEKEGYIVVETNYRVYAYTNSNLQVALLGLFCEMLYRYVFEKVKYSLLIDTHIKA